MKLKKFKERDNKRIGIIVFTLVCILLVSGVILYRTFAIFEVKTNQNIIKGQVQEMGDLRFMVYVSDELQKDMPQKNSDYSLDTSKSYCEDITDSSKRSHISWNQEKWSIEIKDIGTTKTKCYLYFDKLYVDSTLNGAIPDLGNELVAITFDGTGHAVKADLTKEWYNYGEQEWANAVILRSEQDYTAGEEIPEENIESYFVWIPRYEYQIWNGVEEINNFNEVKELGSIDNSLTREELNKQQPILINFTNKNETIKNGNTKTAWITHPAFVSFNCNGFWVGKFETGYNQDGEEEVIVTPNDWSSENAQRDEIDPNRVVIKPNVYSWTNIKWAHAFYTTYDYRRNFDSHMMKNMEWGAIAYLTNSIYGRCSEGMCTRIKINNSQNCVTGSSAVQTPTCGYAGVSLDCNKYGESIPHEDNADTLNYNNPASVDSSTTGNYYGIYDTSGGANEMVMAVMIDKNGKLPSGVNENINSNFLGTLGDLSTSKTEWTIDDKGLLWPDEKYYDLYDYAESDRQFERGKFGDGTKEFGPFYTVVYSMTRQVNSWYAGSGAMPSGSPSLFQPFIRRGGNFSDGSEAGISAMVYAGGDGNRVFSFRVVLTP